MRLSLALAPLLFAFAACSEKSASSGAPPAAAGKPAAALINDAETAEQGGDWKAVLSCADGALADAKATSEEKQAAWHLKISAEAHVNGNDAAGAAVKKMAAGGDVAPAGKLAALAADLVEADFAATAVEVIGVATQKYGNDPAVKDQLARVAKMCETKLKDSGDASGLDKLKSLGYLGGD
jgi:hypothetical protein